MNIVSDAQLYAHAAHDSIRQTRKYTGEPYWVHTDAVAALVASVGGTPEMQAAAHLHDVLEDVYPLNPTFNLKDITAIFGETVAGYVVDLTDVYTKEAYPDLNRAKRKAMERERVAKCCAEVKTIKLADFIHNTESITANDKDFARIYLREKMDMLAYLTEGHPALLNQASMQAVAGFAALGMTIPMITS